MSKICRLFLVVNVTLHNYKHEKNKMMMI